MIGCALGYYQQALERFSRDDPEVLDLLKDRAWLYIFRQEWDKATTDLMLALMQAPEQPGTAPVFVICLRRSCVDAKRYDHAIQYTAQNALALREKNGRSTVIMLPAL